MKHLPRQCPTLMRDHMFSERRNVQGGFDGALLDSQHDILPIPLTKGQGRLRSD